jgi:PTS system N-acetylglucosamine-specific IIB component
VSRAEEIVAALGGTDNIVEVEACITRLRTELANSTLVDEYALKEAGAHGIMRTGSVIQVVVGPEADVIASDIEDLI